MAKVLFLGAALAVFAASGAMAQSDTGSSRDTTQSYEGRSSIRAGNITSTGETVPNPGASQGAGTTDLDRGVQHEDTKIQNSICKGC